MLVGHLRPDHDFTEIVDQGRRGDLLGILDVTPFCQDARSRGAAQGVLPQPHVRRLHHLEYGRGDDEGLYDVEAEEDDGIRDGADPLGKAEEGGVDHLQEFAGQDLVPFYDLAQLSRRDPFVLHHLVEFGDYGRQGRQGLDVAEPLLYGFACTVFSHRLLLPHRPSGAPRPSTARR